MPDLISKADAYEHLRLDYDSDGSPDDGWLDIFIPAISEAVALWLKDEWRLYVVEVDSDGAIVLDSDDVPVIELNSDDEPTVRHAVRAACLVQLASEYRFREGDGANDMAQGGRSIDGRGHGYVLCRGATALLASLRKPTAA